METILFNVDEITTFWFKCTFRNNFIEVEDISWNGLYKVKIQLQRIKDRVVLKVYEQYNENIENGKMNCKLVHEVPYLKNQIYHLDYKVSKDNPLTTFTLSKEYLSSYKTSPDKSFEKKSSYFTITKMMSPKIAKEEYKLLKRGNMIGKVHWDSYDYFDICCHSCHHPNSPIYECLSSPSYGRVLILRDDDLYDEDMPKYYNGEKLFYIKNKVYKKLEQEYWDILTWYNKKEYETFIETYKPTKITYFTEKDFNDLLKGLLEEKINTLLFRKFEDFWKYMCSDNRVDYLYYDNKFNRYCSIIDESRSENDYDKVITLDWINFDRRYPQFETLWNIECTQDEIDNNGNIMGGGWRNLETKEIIGRKIDDILDTSKYEQVVTLGMHNSYYPKSIDCPICKRMHEISQSGYNWMGYKKYLRPFYKILKKEC